MFRLTRYKNENTLFRFILRHPVANLREEWDKACRQANKQRVWMNKGVSGVPFAWNPAATSCTFITSSFVTKSVHFIQYTNDRERETTL